MHIVQQVLRIELGDYKHLYDLIAVQILRMYAEEALKTFQQFVRKLIYIGMKLKFCK